MSIPSTVQFRCRKCGKKIKMTAWESINTDTPNVVQKIMTRELFAFTCPRCNCKDHVEYDVLYNDMNHNIMIQVLHNLDATNISKIGDLYAQMSAISGSAFRIVPDTIALAEKVTALEHGRDDRILELCKHTCFTVFIQRDNPDFHLRRAIYAFNEEKNIDYLSFWGEKGEHLIAPFDEPLTKLYDSLLKIFLFIINDESQGQYVFDYKWAADFISAHEHLFSEEAGSNAYESEESDPFEDEDFLEDEHIDPYSEEEHQLLQPLLDALLQIPPDYNFVDQQIEAKQISPRLVTKLGYDYVSTLHIESCDERNDGDRVDDSTWEELSLTAGKHSTYLYEVMDMLLEFGLDPNYYESGDSSYFLMDRVTCISNGFVAPDTLALLIEHGGNSDTIVDGWNLYDHVYNNLSFSICCDDDDRRTHWYNLSLAHCWFVLLGYGCCGSHDNGNPLEFRIRDCNGKDGYFDLENLRNHRNYTLAMTHADADGGLTGLSIIDKRNCWEVARLRKDIAPVDIYKKAINSVIIKGEVVTDPDFRRTQSGVSVVTFSVRIFDIFNRSDNADVIECVAWRSLAEKVNDSIKKNDTVVVKGFISIWFGEGSDGNRRKNVDINCDDVEIVD